VKPIRIGLAAAALAIGLLTVGASAALAAPLAGMATVHEQVPDPEPVVPQPVPDAGGAAEIGSVSEIAQGLTSGPRPPAPRPATTAGQFSGPATKSAAIWASRGRPDRLIIVRRSGIDSVQGGKLQRHAVRPVGTITLRTLASYVPTTWLTIDGSTARLSATLVLSTGVTLDIGAPVATLALTGGAAAPAAASVFSGGGVLLLRGVTVVSADPTTGAPMPVGPGRPFILVSRGGRLDAADSVIGDLGAIVGPKTYPGLTFDAGSGGSVVRTTLPRNTIGLKLEQSDGVRLESVTASQSAADGLVLQGDTGSTLLGVDAEGNGGNGVIVSGRSSPRPITGITTRSNHDFGVVIVGQSGSRLSAIATTGDDAGGMEIDHSTDVAVTGFSATDEPIGVYTHVSSGRVTLDGLTVTGGRQGVVVEKTTVDLTLSRSRVEGTELGVSLGGHQMRLTDDSVVDSQTAVAVQRGATDVIADRLTISGGKDGFIANPGTTGLVVRDLSATDVSNTTVRGLSPGEQILGGRIDGSNTGIDVQAPTTLSGITIDGADTGVRARTAKDVRASQVEIMAVAVGINIADGTPLLLSGSRVHALESVRGTVLQQGPNDLSLPPLSVLGAIGVPLVLLAVLLETAAALRQRRRARRRNRLLGPDDASVRPLRADAAASR
jgi:hypothetical protein